MSLPFSLPEPPAVEIPQDIREHIDQAVFQFEANLSGLGMLMMARAGGWISGYRKELTELALICLRRELAARPSGGPG
jgi:hypothetical protein